MNNRPLTYLTDSPDDMVLTPAHLLYGRQIQIAPPLNEIIAEYTPTPNEQLASYQTHYARLSATLKRFQEVWACEYLSSLQEKHYGASPASNRITLRVGNLVFVNLENRPRYL